MTEKFFEKLAMQAIISIDKLKKLVLMGLLKNW